MPACQAPAAVAQVSRPQANVEGGVKGHLALLEEQILQFRQDNEALARLRKQAELAEADLVRERKVRFPPPVLCV